ncbi:MAG: hypothetical protein AAF333_14115 [Planctomycetota bacterium]
MPWDRLKCVGLMSVIWGGGAAAVPVTLPVGNALDTADVSYSGFFGDVGGGFAGIFDASSLGLGGGGDHFDDALGIGLNGLAYGTDTGDLTGSELVLDPVTLDGFEVQVGYRTVGPVLRQLVIVTNVSNATGNATVSWHNNTGNDSSQQVISTSDGDLAAELSDRWVVTADNTTGTDNEVNAWVLFGPGSPAVTPSNVQLVDGLASFGGAGNEGLSAEFDLSLALGQTQSILLFVGIEGINVDGIKLAKNIDLTDSPLFGGLIADLSTQERLQIANYAIPEPHAAFGFVVLGLAVWRRRAAELRRP